MLMHFQKFYPYPKNAGIMDIMPIFKDIPIFCARDKNVSRETSGSASQLPSSQFPKAHPGTAGGGAGGIQIRKRGALAKFCVYFKSS